MQQLRRKPGARRILAFAFLVLAGALASIAVAWCIEIHVAYRGVPNSQTQVNFIEYDGSESICFCMNARQFGYREYLLGFDLKNGHPEIDIWPSTTIPSWVRRPNHLTDRSTGTYAYGFPLPCLKWEYVSAHFDVTGVTPDQTTLYHVFPLTLSSRPLTARLPLRPILPGLLLNTLFYATLFSNPYLLRQSRRHLRLRRGHCPACNYNLLNDFTKPCPECGRTPTLPRPSNAQ